MRTMTVSFRGLIERIESGAPTVKKKLSQKERAKIAHDFESAGLDGNGRFEKPEQGYSAAIGILQNNGIEMDEVVNSWRFQQIRGEGKGRMTISLAWTNEWDRMAPISIKNTMLVLTFYEVEKDRWEVVAYLS